MFLFAYSCGKKPEYFTTDGGMEYKLLDFTGEGVKPNIGEYLSLYTSYFDERDSLFYSSSTFKSNGLEYHQLIEPEPGTFQEVLSELELGDSAIVQIKTADFFKDYLNANVPDFLIDDTVVTIRLRLVNAQSQSEFQQAIAEETDWLEMKELGVIQDFKDSTSLAFSERDGVLITLIESDTTRIEKIKFGDHIKLNYQAMFLESGNIFYSTYRNGMPDEFSYGRSGQLIKGLELALGGRKYGDSIHVIVPSSKAFGGQGSAGGIVPAYTALKYTIRIEQ